MSQPGVVSVTYQEEVPLEESEMSFVPDPLYSRKGMTLRESLPKSKPLRKELPGLVNVCMSDANWLDKKPVTLSPGKWLHIARHTDLLAITLVQREWEQGHTPIQTLVLHRTWSVLVVQARISRVGAPASRPCKEDDRGRCSKGMENPALETRAYGGGHIGLDGFGLAGMRARRKPLFVDQTWAVNAMTRRMGCNRLHLQYDRRGGSCPPLRGCGIGSGPGVRTVARGSSVLLSLV
eukprot:757269-Hanusia_phi.AAC.12